MAGPQVVGLKGGWHSGLVMSGLTHQHAVRLAQVPELALRLRGGTGERGTPVHAIQHGLLKTWMLCTADMASWTHQPPNTAAVPYNPHKTEVHVKTLVHFGCTAGHRGSQKGVSYMQVDGEPWKQAIPTRDGEHFTVGSDPLLKSYSCKSRLV